MIFDNEFTKRFWARTKRLKNGCLVWTGYCARTGYGMLQARKHSKQPMLAHRVAWALKHGPIPDGLHVLHHCDNPPCCEERHLFLGTPKDNSNDRDSKGRVASGNRNGARTKRNRNQFVRNHGSGLHGEDVHSSKLSNVNAAKLRKRFLAGENRLKLASEYGISETHVYRIGKSQSRKDI